MTNTGLEGPIQYETTVVVRYFVLFPSFKQKDDLIAFSFGLYTRDCLYELDTHGYNYIANI